MTVDGLTLSNEKDMAIKKDDKVECNTGAGQGINNCQYFAANKTAPTFLLPCECQYSSQVRGYCPLPNAKFMQDNSQMMQKTLNYSHACHTLDRFNLIAHKDCGSYKYGPESVASIFDQTLD